jgi:hypothetical protein
MQVHLQRQKFQTDDELKCSVQNWLYIQGETFYAAGICTLPGKYKLMIGEPWFPRLKLKMVLN